MAVAVSLSATVAPAKSQEPQEDPVSLHAQLEKALSAAAKAAAEAVEMSKDAIAQAEQDLAPKLRTFQQLLSEQKAQLDKLGEDATARFEAWTHAFTESWAAAWPDIRRSAEAALENFREWLETQSTSDEQIHI
ncbi:MAG: hypothetical protein R3D01_11235 [Hyphomicrobiales bacterium]